jgi:hypothetical protein
VVAVGLHGLANLFLVDGGCLGQFLDGGMALVLLLELINLVIDFIERANLIQRQTYDTALLCDGL